MASDSEGGSSAMVSLVSSATRLQISTELVIKEERAHVEWKPSQWSCCWVGRDVSQVKLSKFTVHVLHCLPEFVHSLLIDMVLCLTQYNILLSLYFESWMNGYEENLFRLRVSLYWGQSYTVESAFFLYVGCLMITVMTYMQYCTHPSPEVASSKMEVAPS